MTPEEQRQDIKNAIAYYDARGADWLDIVGYLSAVYTGCWPPPKRERKPKKAKGTSNEIPQEERR